MDDQHQHQDFLAVFQASPLATVSDDGTPYALDRLDFEHERESLVRVFNEASGARLHVEFEVATTERLGDFLAKGKGRILHFSCHGSPQYLAVDDGWGQMQALEPRQLKEWISICGHRLKFVFLSACHSETIGQAFIDAGVPHVLCCSGKVRAEAAVEFEKDFYRALANGIPLLEAFKLARQQLLVCPTLEEGVRQEQAHRFLLLPSQPPYNNHHDVQIFSAGSISPGPAALGAARQNIPRAYFPPAPELFRGRDLDIFRILKVFREGTRLVNISGRNGIGKSALVKAFCRYISNRLHIMNIDEIIWLPFDQPEQEQQVSVVKCWMEEVFDRMQDDAAVWIFQDQCADRIRQIMHHLQDRRSLIVIEAKNILKQGMSKLASFLQNLFLNARHIKVIVVHRDGSDMEEISARQMQCVEANLEVAPLSFDHTLALFGLMCPHVTSKTVEIIRSSEELSGVLRPRYEQGSESRRAYIFKMLGEGVPEDIYRIAKHMTPDTYRKLINVADDPEEDEADVKYETRAALIRRQDDLSRKIDVAAAEGDFRLAEECQTVLNHTESLKKEHCDMFVLKQKLEDATYQLEEAKSGKDWSSARDLKLEVERITETLQSEKEALFAFMKDKIGGICIAMEQARNREDSLRARQFELELEYVRTNWQVEQDAFIAFGIVETEDENTEVFRTRRWIVVKIEELNRELRKACDVNDFDKAQEMYTKLSRLEELKGLRSSKKKLISSVSQLEAKLSQAKTNRDWAKAKVVHRRLEEVKAKLELEEEAEEKWGKSEEESESLIEQELHFPVTSEDTGDCPGDDKSSGDSGKAHPFHIRTNSDQPGTKNPRVISTTSSSIQSSSSEYCAPSPVLPRTGAVAINGIQSTYRSPPGEEDTFDVSTVGSFRTLGTRVTGRSTVVASEIDGHSLTNPLQGEVVRAGLEEEQRIQRIVDATIRSITIHAECVQPVAPRRKSSLRRHLGRIGRGKRRNNREDAILIEQFFGCDE